MALEIRVNNKTYTQFKQVDITKSIDDFSSETRIVTTEPVNDSSFIKINDLIEIFLDDIQVVTGYAEKISDKESNTSHDISYRVRDKIQDIIDSSVPDTVKTLKDITLFKDLCQQVIDGLGMEIDIIDDVNAKFSDELKAAEIGQTCIDFLQGYARKVQVFLNTDGKGNIWIRRPGGKLKTILLSIPGNIKNNILDSNIELDYSKRFYRYRVRSNGNITAKKDTKALNQLGEALDNDIRKTRIFEKVAETPMTAEECKNAAIEEANIRRIRAFNYTCQIVGFSANDELWKEGKLVKVKDERKGIDGTFVIRSISYRFSNSGETTSMNLTLSDAYTLAAEPSEITKRTTKDAETYTGK